MGSWACSDTYMILCPLDFPGTCDDWGSHGTSGEALWYRVSNGTYTLRMENFMQSPGPDVFMYVVQTGGPGNCEPCAGALYSGNTLVPLDGTDSEGHATKSGNFNQPLPDWFDPADADTTVFWCRQFDSQFGHCYMEFEE